MKKKEKEKKLTFKELFQNGMEVTNLKWNEAKGIYLGNKEGQDALVAAATATQKLGEIKNNVDNSKINLAKTILMGAGMVAETWMHNSDQNQANFLRLASNGYFGTKECEQNGKNFNLRKYYQNK